MSKTFDPEKELWNFLGGVFHQDMGTAEKALEEFIEENSKGWLRIMVQCISVFLASNRSEQEKARFIEENTFINFSYLGLTPVQWLEHVKERIEEAVKAN